MNRIKGKREKRKEWEQKGSVMNLNETNTHYVPFICFVCIKFNTLFLFPHSTLGFWVVFVLCFNSIE